MSHVPPPRDPNNPYDAQYDDADAVPEGASGKAIAALVLGLFSFVFSFFAGLPAIVLGSLSLGEISRGGGRIGGRGMAISGIVLGCLGSVLSLIVIPIALLLPAIQAARAAARLEMSRQQLKEVGFAVLAYQSQNGSLPAAFTTDEDGRPLESWRVAVLPYLEQKALYDRFDHSQSWNSRGNAELADNAPEVYVAPGDDSNDGSETNVVAIVGDETLWPADRQVDLRRIPDGPATTLLLVNLAGTGIKWSEPRDLSVKEFLAAVRRESGAGPHAYRGRFLILMGDGNVRTFESDILPQHLEAMLTRAGDEAVVLP